MESVCIAVDFSTHSDWDVVNL